MNALARSAAWLIVRLRWPILLAWIAAAVAAVVFLPSLQESGGHASLRGLVPKNAESVRTAKRLAELFEVPVITHAHIVQRNPDGRRTRSPARRSGRRRSGRASREPPTSRRSSRS